LSGAQLKLYSSLKQKKYRRRHGLFIADGPHLVQAALNSDWEIERIIIRNDKLDYVRHLNPPGNTISIASSPKFDKLTDSQTPQGILAVVRIKKADKHESGLIKRARMVVAVDNVSDPGNAGTIIRTAAAFNYDLVVCIGECAELHNPKTVRATQGALFTIPVITISSPSRFLTLFAGQFNLVTFSGSAKKPLSKAARIKRPVLVFGSEITGVNSEIERQAKHRFRIDQTDKIESLNVAVAAGVAMYKFFRGYGG
jgi:TrmH family RNA methyltransferase